MERAREFLGRAVRRLNRPEAALAWLQVAWPEIAGAALAAHTHPARLLDQCLVIETDGKRWEKQLETMTGEFCLRVNQTWGGTLVREVRFVEALAPGSHSISRAENNRYTPFVHRRKFP
jgi:predicted nucleic acid-binding Zn ribbon protein